MALNEGYIRVKRQLITGMNTRGHPQLIGPSQVEKALNVDLTNIGRNAKRGGVATQANDVGALDFTNLSRFNPSGGSDIILGIEDTNLRKWTGTGNWSAAIDSGFTSNLYTAFIPGNNICLISNGTDNVHSIDNADSITDELDTNTDPPKGVVGVYFKDRFLIALNDLVYFSDVASTTFDRSTNFFRVNVGDNSAGEITNMIPFRSNELIIFKDDSIWLLRTAGNSTPLSEWSLEPVDVNSAKSSGYGCISKESAIKVGDDIYYFARDGVRSLRRNEQDKIIGTTLPVSDPIFNTWIENINWAHADKIRGIYFQNKLIFSVPYDTSTVPDYWFVYHFQGDPSLNGWSVWKMGVSARSFVKYQINGDEKLYFSEHGTNGQMYTWPSGTSDNGTAIEFELRGRMEDLSEYQLGPHEKVLQSFYATFETADSSTATVEGQTDEAGFSPIGTKDLTSTAPTLPITLPFDLNNATLTRAKFDGNKFEHWYNFQWKITQDTLDETLTIQDIALMITAEDYEHEV